MITLLESGVGAVVQSSLYKPLANKNDDELSKIVKSSKKFFNKIMLIMLFYVLVLIFVYPYIVKLDFDFVYTALLIVILAFSYIAQHYLFITYRILLNADQLSFLQIGVHTICLLLNAIITIALIKLNMGIHLVKLVSALVFSIQPIFLKIVVDRKYKINLNVELTEEPIKQKWNGFAQHISSVVLGNTDTVILTLFSTLENVSVYSIYYLVVHGVKQILTSMMSGIQALLGNMIAKKENDKLNKTFSTIEWLINNIVLLMYTLVGILIIPFVKIYTINFSDANYIVPSFGIMITLAYAMYTFRTPYELVIKAAGHYKETQASSLIEVAINVLLSIILVFKFGLIGVAIGTFAAMTYRTIYLIYYLSKNILNKSYYKSIKLFIEDLIAIAIIIVLTRWVSIENYTYFELIVMAIKCGFISVFIIAVINLIFNRRDFNNLIDFLKKK